MSRIKRIDVICAALAATVIAGTAPIAAAITVIDANSFTFKSSNAALFPTARDFHLSAAGAITKVKSSVFPNRTVSGGTADFSGNTLADGASHNVTFESTAGKPKPRGYFTCLNAQGVDVQCSAEVSSKALDGSTVAFVPDGLGGYDFTLTITNEFGGPLTGLVTAYINRPGATAFNIDDFTTLANETQIFSASYALGDGQVLTTLTGSLDSADAYLLLLGTADADDGAGSFPWAIGFSPRSVPAPATLPLLAGAIAALALRRNV